jgi:hypothetical protein
MRDAVATRAHDRCEYCAIGEDATLARHEPDHIIGEQHRGETILANLAYACFHCNRFKGPNIATIDPDTGALVRLFNPRADHWMDHFELAGAVIVARTAIGRGTAELLHFNGEPRVALRAELLRQGRYSPQA